MLDLIRNRGEGFIVARLLGATAVGIYNVGGEIAAMPTAEIVGPLCRACFSAFAEGSDDPQAGRRLYTRVVSAMLLLTVPAGFGVSALAGPIVFLVLGPHWTQAAPVVEIFGIASMFGVVCAVSSTMLSARGMLGDILRVNVVFTLVRITLLLSVVPFTGVVGAALAVLVSQAFDQALYMWFAFKRLQCRLIDLVSSNWRGVCGASVMMLVLRLTGLGWGPAPLAVVPALGWLAAGVLAGVAVYLVFVGGCWLASGRPDGPERDFLTLFGKVLRRR